MREFEGDTHLFHAQYGPAIEAGDPVVCGAIVNSPMQLQVDPALLRTAGEKYRLAQNPMAADRLGTLTKAQTTHDDIFNFARGELGLNAQADNIDDLAAGKPLTAEMQEVKIE